MNQRVSRKRRCEDGHSDVNKLAERLGFICVHIPKTGGTSIKHAFGYGGGFDHKTALLLREQIRPDIWSRSFKFCFVRNPWDRMVSWFEFGRHNILDKRNRRFDSFDEWIHAGLPHSWGLEWHTQDQDDNPLRQFNFLMDHHRRELVDFVGRFENIQEDFAYILSQVGGDVQLPKINVGARRKERRYDEYYTPETRDIVGKMFAEEINYFEYRYQTS